MKRFLIDALFLLAPVAVIVGSCTNPDATRSTLEDMGFTNIEITGYDAFACSDSDGTCTGFTALNPQGRPVKGAVGCSRVTSCGKGCTVRFK